MAERSNATAKKTQDQATDVGTLQKRGRRRLVGAIALVLLAVIVLPMVFDTEPKQGAPLVNIRIPGEDGGKFTPKTVPHMSEPLPSAAQQQATSGAAVPGATPTQAAPATPAPAMPTTTGADKLIARVEPPTVKSEPASEPLPEPKPVAKSGSKTASGERIIFQVGAFSSAEKVKEVVDQLQAAKLPHYTETVATAKGTVTRVRIGPFAAQTVADKALARAKALGMNPVNVVPR